jgi:hypothetical protein
MPAPQRVRPYRKLTHTGSAAARRDFLSLSIGDGRANAATAQMSGLPRFAAATEFATSQGSSGTRNSTSLLVAAFERIAVVSGLPKL